MKKLNNWIYYKLEIYIDFLGIIIPQVDDTWIVFIGK